MPVPAASGAIPVIVIPVPQQTPLAGADQGYDGHVVMSWNFVVR